jgi:hypothetical protein
MRLGESGRGDDCRTTVSLRLTVANYVAKNSIDKEATRTGLDVEGDHPRSMALARTDGSLPLALTEVHASPWERGRLAQQQAGAEQQLHHGHVPAFAGLAHHLMPDLTKRGHHR